MALVAAESLPRLDDPAVLTTFEPSRRGILLIGQNAPELAEEVLMAATDVRRDLVERVELRNDGASSGLDRRLEQLPDGHPASPRYADAPFQQDRVRPLTDAEHAEHIADVRARLEEARAAGLSTDVQHTIHGGREVWTDERELLHNSIIEDLYSHADEAPCEHRAILAGGLAGAGKTTVLNEQSGIDLSEYLMINPDLIKEELVRRGMVPEVEGLSQMEATELAHEESSHIAKRLAQRAQADGKNIIWDITMSSGASAEGRIDLLRSSGYMRIEAVFVDIPVDVSVRRADIRHRQGHDDYLAGNGTGGRYVSAELILAQSDEAWGSKNRAHFEQMKVKVDMWSRYDNSVDGRRPILADAHPMDDERRSALSDRG